MAISSFSIAFLLAFLGTAGVLQWMQMPSYPHEVWSVLGLLGILSVSIAVFGRFTKGFRPSFGLFLLCIVAGSSLAFLRVAQTTHVSSPDSVEQFATGERVTLHGTIAAEPDRRPMKTKYTVEVDSVRLSPSKPGAGVILRRAQDDTLAQDDTFPATGRILATDHSAYPRHNYGDEVLVTGVLEKPGQIEDFHYDRYLSRYGIYSVMYRAQVQTLSTGHGNRFFASLFTLKERFEAQLNRLYPEPHASFMAGLLTGSRKGIPEHLLADFQTTGLTHIIAISGYNITIVIAVISSLLFFLPLKWRFVPSVFAIIAFTFFVGASPAVVRAAIMGCLGLLALQFGRQTHILISILFTAFLMTAWNPKVLWYDVGFQLSFLSVLGLVYLAPLLERMTSIFPKTLAIRESLQMTIAAQLAAVPLVIVIFGHFSLIAPLANVVVAPFIPLAMLFGFVGTALSFVSYPLGLLISYLGWGALELIILSAQFFAALPHALMDASFIDARLIWLYYGALALLLPLIHKYAGTFLFRRT